MTDRNTFRDRKKRTSRPPPRPLDAARLQEIALAYVARFATTSSKLESYLSRKIRERGWNDGEPGEAGDEGQERSGALPDLTEISARLVELGYIDDEAYARSRSGGLLRRGFGPRRVSQDLYAAGIDEQTRSDVAPEETAIRTAALAMARKRRFGPYAAEEPDRDRKQKQIAAMMRAGHGFDAIRAIMDAQSVTAAEEWAAEEWAAEEWAAEVQAEDQSDDQNEDF